MQEKLWSRPLVTTVKRPSVDTSKSHTNSIFPRVLGWTWTSVLQCAFWISRYLSTPSLGGSSLAICHPYQRDPVSLYMLVHAHDKCNFKYTMRPVTRVQVFELWPVKCGSFFARKKRKAAMVARRILWMGDGVALDLHSWQKSLQIRGLSKGGL
jgi:hypothetical protein